MNDPEIQFYPAWKEAVERFLRADFKPDDIITYQWLFDAFGLPQPDPKGVKAEQDKLELHFLAQFKPFQKELLEKHQIDLANERGVGYRLVPPNRQSALAAEDGVQETRKALRRMGSRLANVDLSKLSADERRENAEAQAKWAMMTGMLKRARKLSYLPKPDET